MKNESNTAPGAAKAGSPSPKGPKDSTRRKLLSQIGATFAAGMLARDASASGQSRSSAGDGAATSDVDAPEGISNSRVHKSFALRVSATTNEARIPTPPHSTNGDETRYSDKSATYTKGLLQDGPCKVNLFAYETFKTALNSGEPDDFEKITLGGTRKLNCPQGGLTFDLEGSDSVQFGNAPSHHNQEDGVVVPPPPALASAAYGTELVELYWASLLRDVAFTDYATSSVANAAAQELSTMPAYAGPRKGSGQVTPDLLFRGAFPGETVGPYISQFFITPTACGAQAMSQQMTSYLPNLDYMTDASTFQQVQNGISTGLVNQSDAQPRYMHDGRGLGAYTHVDVLYQAYFTAYLVLNTLGVPLNPGNPYAESKTQIGFGSFGQPHFATLVAEVATRALNAVWYQKWFVHLRHRPESGGGIAHLIATGQGGTIQGKLSSNVMDSNALQASFNKYGSYFLSQAFPEGSPTHPAYPTGHGTVGGACITILKFFFDGNFVLPNPLVPTSDGLALGSYSGADAGQLTVNGELNKLAHNVSFGHGILSGIHWRSDSDSSMLLGEAVAISILQDKAQTFNEKFTVNFTKLDGTTATISNQ
ncbi:vanadium-dependent haloperoxidase [Edaphobacter aggregans]|uniref:vanadium-dependent haloperoxidase n=1 Tax=Edaphobacter aggregans TaxID=570835 RepID=UPI00068CEBC9|nr:vanadium-dependent haloperoxidase [Edaphobacter aggregans]